MANIMIIEPSPLVRLGLVQLLSGIAPDITIQSSGYPDLSTLTSTSNDYDLVLVSIYDNTLANRVRQTQRMFNPNAILVMSECTTMPETLNELPPAISGYIASSSPPEVLQAAVRLVLAGGTCFPRRTEFSGVNAPQSRNNLTVQRNSPGQANTTINGISTNNGNSNVNYNGNTHPESPISSMITTYSPTRWPLLSEANANSMPSRREHELLGLTPRQYEVLVLLARGYPMKTIGRQLNISVATAKAHTETLYQRLNVHNRNAAVYAAVSKGAKLGWTSIGALAQDPIPKSSGRVHS